MKLPELDYKKVLLFAGFIIIAAFFAWLIYMMFFGSLGKKVATPDEEYEDYYNLRDGQTANINQSISGGLTTDNKNTNISQPTTNEGVDRLPETKDVVKITKDIVQGAIIDNTGSGVIYYNNADGKFYEIYKNGTTKVLSDQTFYNAQDISWSDDKNKAIIEYPDGSNIIYDFATEKQTTIPANWENFNFASDNKKIVTKSLDANQENNHLIIADTVTGNAKIIEELSDQSSSFQINISPTNQIVAFFTKNIDLNHQEIFPIGQNDEKFSSFIVDGQGFQGKWSPNGEQMIYSVYNIRDDYKPNLWITNKFGSAKKRILINTWSEKCAFYNNSVIYCAVPQSLEKMMGLSPDYAIDINDDIYRIDLSINSTEKITLPEIGHNIKDLMITNNEQELYFTDRRTGRLYKINL
jgi:hypothetical protein